MLARIALIGFQLAIADSVYRIKHRACGPTELLLMDRGAAGHDRMLERWACDLFKVELPDSPLMVASTPPSAPFLIAEMLKDAEQAQVQAMERDFTDPGPYILSLDPSKPGSDFAIRQLFYWPLGSAWRM